MEIQDGLSLHQQARKARAGAIGDLILKLWRGVSGFVSQRHAMPKTFPKREYYPWP